MFALYFSSIGLVLCLGTSVAAGEQAVQDPAATPSVVAEPRGGDVSASDTPTRGFNGGLMFSGVHDSFSGWYTVATSFLSYTFPSLSKASFSADVSLPIYPYRQAQNTDTATDAQRRFVPAKGDLSDLLVSGRVSFTPGCFLRDSGLRSLEGRMEANSETSTAVPWLSARTGTS